MDDDDDDDTYLAITSDSVLQPGIYNICRLPLLLLPIQVHHLVT